MENETTEQQRPTILTEQQAMRLLKKYSVKRTLADLEVHRRRDGNFPAKAINDLIKAERGQAAREQAVTEHRQRLAEKVDQVVRVLREFIKQPEYVEQGYALEKTRDGYVLTRRGKFAAKFRLAGRHTCPQTSLRFAMLRYPGFREDGLLRDEDFI